MTETSFVVHTGGFVTLPNEAVNDQQLSFRARGVLAYMLGRPVGWRFSAERIAAAGQEGRDAVRAALVELRERGYYRTRKHRNADGTFTTLTECAATPELLPPLADAAPPEAGYQSSVHQTSVSQSSMSIQRTNKENQRTKDSCSTDVERARGDGFDAFWNAYPLHVGKQAAARAYSKARKSVSAEQLIAGAVRYANDPNRDDSFTAHASTWLNAGRWADEPLPARARSGRVADGDELLRRWHAEAVAASSPQLRLAP